MGNRCNICVGSIDLLKFSIPPTTYSNSLLKIGITHLKGYQILK